MRKQIAAANWKMNLTYQQGSALLQTLVSSDISLNEHQAAVFAVPYPYLAMAVDAIHGKNNYFIAAQNCSNKKSGAYTGEVSAEMLKSLNLKYCIVGHSERREYYGESNQILTEKLNLCLANNITPIFCCGEALPVREQNQQNSFVEQQLKDSLFHLSKEEIMKIVIAYEPIWAIGTGKT
ncbi:MAG: triose-phosphate isomerase, partial [Bacteroidota bacterium]|nr:triose-phosphate isomerase [Bacteroidota bacterium]